MRVKQSTASNLRMLSRLSRSLIMPSNSLAASIKVRCRKPIQGPSNLGSSSTLKMIAVSNSGRTMKTRMRTLSGWTSILKRRLAISSAVRSQRRRNSATTLQINKRDSSHRSAQSKTKLKMTLMLCLWRSLRGKAKQPNRSADLSRA